MKKDLWEPKRRIEKNYQTSLRKITEFIEKSINGLSDPFEIVARIRNFIRHNDFSKHAESAAMKMVTHIFSDSGRTWRQAARENSKGINIHSAYTNELKGSIGSEVYNQIKRNSQIIKTLPDEIAEKVTKYISEQSSKGVRSTEIASEIQKMFPAASKAKADLIARTEVSKTATALTKARAYETGLDWYIWRTSDDSRVRDSHKIMEGVLIRWSEPPSPEELAEEPKKYGHYHAGDIFNCRCYPQPLINMDDVVWPHKVYINGEIIRMTRAKFEKL